MSPLAYLTFYQNKFNMTLSQNNNNATVKKLNHSVKPDMMLVGKKLTHMEGFSYGSY